MTSKALLIAALTAVVGGAAAVPAHAGVATVDGDVLRYTAADGETNVVRVVRAPRRLLFACALLCTGEDVRPPAFLVTDERAPVSAGPGCVAAGSAAAVCTLPRDHIDVEVVAELGDRADAASADGAFRFVADGGDGPDSLRGHDGADGAATLLGGGGDDVLTGGLGADVAQGGGGDDRLEMRESPAMPDEASCGRGEDVVVLGQWDVLTDDRCETVDAPAAPPA
jgi:Ca2+-binding RTX toxin-like protein